MNCPGLLDESFRALGNIGIGVNRELHVDGNLPALEGDAVLLRQAFINLIKNAYEAMKDGGTLSVRAQVEKGDGAESRKRKYVRLDFKDTGHGLDPIHRRENFYAFFHHQVRRHRPWTVPRAKDNRLSRRQGNGEGVRNRRSGIFDLSSGKG